MSNDYPSESTPLLRAAHLPSLSPTLIHISNLEINQIRFEDLQHPSLADHHSVQVAFVLTILLQLRRTRLHLTPVNDIYHSWQRRIINEKEVNALEEQITDTWNSFLTERRSDHDIEVVLWTKFPMEDQRETLRVLDFLGGSDPPAALLSHPLVLSNLQHTWRRGISLSYANTSSWFTHYDMMCTPQVSHFIDWICHVIYLVLLIDYIISPIEQPHTWSDWFQFQYGPRELFLLLVSLSFLAQPRSITNASSFLTPFAFLISLPSVPQTANQAFNILQWGLILHVLGLNLPYGPSHLFLVSHHLSLPLATLLNRGLCQIIFPVVLFFLPLFFFATYTLSLSMFDTFMITPTSQLYPSLITPAPVETRLTFLFLFLLVLALLFISTFITAAAFPTLSQTGNPWDRYSLPIGLEARRIVIRTTAFYMGPYTFPPPFNIAHILLIRMPRFGARLFGIQTSNLVDMEHILWRVTVGPFMAFVTLLFWRPIRILPQL